MATWSGITPYCVMSSSYSLSLTPLMYLTFSRRCSFRHAVVTSAARRHHRRRLLKYSPNPSSAPTHHQPAIFKLSDDTLQITLISPTSSLQKLETKLNQLLVAGREAFDDLRTIVAVDGSTGGKICGSNRRAVDIPSDLLEEILHRLRSNDLLNFKLVCKDWERLISSPGFIQKHLKRSNVGYYPPRILVPCDDCDGDYDDDITIGKILDCADTTNATKRIPLSYDVTFLGSCDGLVLYQEDSGVIGALNLSTGKYEVRTPNPSIEKVLNIKTICTWFGHHPSTGEYVLALANPYDSEEGDGANKPRRRVVFEVHSLSRNDTGHSLLSSSTRELDWDFDLQTGLGSYMYGPQYNPRRFGSNIYHNVGAFLRGRVHCPVPVSPRIYGDYRAEILAYDLEANDIIRMPTPLESCDGLGVHDGSLIALHSTAVWVMKEYGVEESWTKYAEFPYYGLLHASFSPHGDIFCVDKDFYYDDGGDLTMYFLPAKKTVTVRANVGYTWRASCIGGIDSLVSPALVWTKKG